MTTGYRPIALLLSDTELLLLSKRYRLKTVVRLFLSFELQEGVAATLLEIRII